MTTDADERFFEQMAFKSNEGYDVELVVHVWEVSKDDWYGHGIIRINKLYEITEQIVEPLRHFETRNAAGKDMINRLKNLAAQYHYPTKINP